MLMPTGRLFTTSPTATSSLLFGLGTYFFLGKDCSFLWNVAALGGRIEDKESLGARDQVEPLLPLMEARPREARECRDVRKLERDDEDSDAIGEVGRGVRLPVGVFERSGLWDDLLASGGRGALLDDDKLVARWREEKVG